MKSLVMLASVLLSVPALAAPAEQEITKYIIKKSTDTKFYFEGIAEGDGCNGIFLSVDLKLISENKAKKQRVYEVDPMIGQTAMACDTYTPTPTTVTSEIYQVPAGHDVRFHVPSWLKIKLVK